jgi:glycosyltransferase involved in cell wall biosynthesis
MLTGCIPVVSRAGALPELVGDAGIYVDPLTPQAIAAALEEAFAAPETMRIAARERVATTFGLDRYAERLLTELSELLV